MHLDGSGHDASIAALRADIEAQDEARVIDDANVGLEIVDAIEGVFGP